jgi:hypothetical protein
LVFDRRGVLRSASHDQTVGRLTLARRANSTQREAPVPAKPLQPGAERFELRRSVETRAAASHSGVSAGGSLRSCAALSAAGDSGRSNAQPKKCPLAQTTLAVLAAASGSSTRISSPTAQLRGALDQQARGGKVME